MKRRVMIGLCAGAIIILLGQSFGKAVNEVSRNAYGEGNKQETFWVTVDGVFKREEVTLEIPERSYTYEEVQELFSRVIETLDEMILGENQSKDHVTQNLYLPEELKEFPVQIRWKTDRYDVVDFNGKIMEEELKQEGVLVELRGILTYQDYEAMYVTNICVYPKELTESEAWIEGVTEAFARKESLTKEEKTIGLPQTVGGKQVTWEKKPDYRIFAVMGLLAFLSWAWKIQKKQELKEVEEKRRQQMRLDYPEIVSTFALLLGTGMTVKNAWNKIVRIYEEETQSEKNRFAYEEMCLTSREMKGGISELEAYERFGKRCNVSCYTKFAMLLSQNLRKGSKGLTELLKMESLQALEQRKNLAKKRGEEASAKLMIPMFIMFFVVLLMIMIPAFLSIQL